MAGKKIEIPTDSAFLIGRDSSCDLCLAERKISRQHSRLYFDSESKVLFLEDLESLNGTYLNTKQIESRVELHDGDQIRVGSHLIQVLFKSDKRSPEQSLPISPADPRATDQEAKEFFYQSGMSDSRRSKDAYEEFDDLELLESELSEIEKTGGRIISGKLSELSLPDLMQMLATTRKSGVLVVSHRKPIQIPPEADPNSVLIFIDKGELEAATYGSLMAEEAFYAALEFQDGYFALFPLPERDFPNRIEIPLEMMLLEGLRRLDERKANEQTLIETDILEALPGESLSGLSSDELKIFQLSWKHKRVKKVIEMSHLDRDQTVGLLRKLIKSNLLKKTS